jgi:hypothetical protein
LSSCTPLRSRQHLGGDYLHGLAQQNAESRFIEEEEAGGSTAKSAVSATGSVFRM